MILVNLGTFHLPLAVSVSWPVIIVFLALFMLMAALVFVFRMQASPREEVNVARADPPVRRPGDPAFVAFG